MQINVYKLLIPVSPDSINKVMQFGRKESDITQLKKKWERIAITFIEEAQADGDLPARFNGRISVFFKLYFAMARNRDGDNYEAMCKGITDALVVKRLVLDDNSKVIDDDGRRLRIDPDRPRVEVLIKEKLPDGSLVEIDNYHRYESEEVEIEYGQFSPLQSGESDSLHEPVGKEI